MRFYASKPSSDAGLRPIQDFLPVVAGLALLACMGRKAKDTSASCAGSLPAHRCGGLSFTGKQSALACQTSTQTGRRRAPSGVPMSTCVLMGGEGSTSREVVACAAGASSPALPGRV